MAGGTHLPEFPGLPLIPCPTARSKSAKEIVTRFQTRNPFGDAAIALDLFQRFLVFKRSIFCACVCACLCARWVSFRAKVAGLNLLSKFSQTFFHDRCKTLPGFVNLGKERRLWKGKLPPKALFSVSYLSLFILQKVSDWTLEQIGIFQKNAHVVFEPRALPTDLKALWRTQGLGPEPTCPPPNVENHKKGLKWEYCEKK